MNFEISTEVNLDMTVRITGRDQATGADVLKLNAKIESIKKKNVAALEGDLKE